MTRRGDQVRARLAKRFPNFQAELRAKIEAATAEPERVVAGGARWAKVPRAERWRPTWVGETLVGEYAGATPRAGQYGTYDVHAFRTADGMRTVAGMVISELVAAAAPTAGKVVRVVFTGQHVSGAGHKYSTYDLFLLDE